LPGFTVFIIDMKIHPVYTKRKEFHVQMEKRRKNDQIKKKDRVRVGSDTEEDLESNFIQYI